MAYCVNTDVTALLKDQTFSDSSKVTLSNITEIISRKDAWINARLNTVYTVPITGTASLLLMKEISMFLSAAEVWARLHPANLPEGETDWASRWTKECKETIKKILEGDMELTDATKVNTVARNHSSLAGSGVNELSSSDAGYNSQFTMGDTF